MARDFAAEYRSRVERGRARGLSLSEARGHGATPEHPLAALRNPERYVDAIRRRFDRYEALAQTDRGAKALAQANLRRRSEGKGPIVIGFPPYPGPGLRQTTFDDFEEAEPHSTGIPTEYVTFYLSPDGVTLEIRRSERRRARRRAA